MSGFHQLWQPPVAAGFYAEGKMEIVRATKIGAATARERKFIEAARLIFADPALPYGKRALAYERAMDDLARQNKDDTEVQVFYALALLANASPSDQTHSRQKQAADLLEPLFRTQPRHPGIAHYLIHACDNGELASRGLEAARLYAQIAPSAPHALHMPSHIFTRLGLWENSISSNTAAEGAAHRAGDVAEELHAMDYLVYAYLQTGQDREAAKVIERLKAMPQLDGRDFKIAYASTAMPVRYLVERRQWAEAAEIAVPTGVPVHVSAIVLWARGIGAARSGDQAGAQKAILELESAERQLHAQGDTYWATQVGIMTSEVKAWKAQASKHLGEAATWLRSAADREDGVEKLPVTPGPIVPAREQLGDLLMEQGHPELAATEYRAALANAPGRRAAVRGLAMAQRLP